jgi:hypothetical protein
MIANKALDDLRTARSVFETAASNSVLSRIQNGCKLVQKMVDRAEKAQLQFNADRSCSGPKFTIPPAGNGEDDLALFGPSAKLLILKSVQSNSDSESPQSTPRTEDHVMNDIHPSLLEYINDTTLGQAASFIKPASGTGYLDQTPFNFSDVSSIEGDPAREEMWNAGLFPELRFTDTFENYLVENRREFPQSEWDQWKAITGQTFVP